MRERGLCTFRNIKAADTAEPSPTLYNRKKKN